MESAFSKDWIEYCVDTLHNIFPVLEMEHLIRSRSNHTPLLITFKETTENVIKPFRFMNFWLQEESFMGVIKNYWKADFLRVPF